MFWSSTLCMFVFGCVIVSTLADLNPYKVLGVDKRSGLDEIKRAYKQLALQYHPDRNHEDGANDQFILVNEAYQILSTAETRRLYDLFGYAHVSSIHTGKHGSGRQRHHKVPEAGTYFYATVNSSEYDDDLTSHHKSSMRRFSDRMSRVRDKLSDSIRKRDVLPVVSVLGTITFLLMLGFLLSYFDPVSIERRRRRRQAAAAGAATATGNGVLSGTQSQELRVLHKDRLVHELKPQTYQALVRNLKPGHRSIILLVDNQTKDELVQRFGDIVYRYRKNKSLLFAYLNVDLPDRLDWYRRLLQQTLVMVERRLHLIPRKCCGTVLSLNGFRRHYSIYHAMHRDSQPRSRRARSSRTHANGSFVGFDSEEEDEDDYITEDDGEEDYPADIEWNANNIALRRQSATSRRTARDSRSSNAAVAAAEMSALTADTVEEPSPKPSKKRVGSLASGASNATTASCSSGSRSSNSRKKSASTVENVAVTVLTPESDPPSYEDLVKRNLIDATSADYLLAGLSQWLDRLFDGQLQDYYINTWPMLR